MASTDKDQETNAEDTEARVDPDQESADLDSTAEASDSESAADADAAEASAAADADADAAGDAEPDEAGEDARAESSSDAAVDETATKPSKKGGKGRSKDGMTAGARLAAAKAAKAARKAAKRGKEKKEQDPVQQVRDSDLVKKAQHAGNWAAENRNAVVAIAAALVLAFGGWVGWRFYSDAQAQAAGALLDEAVTIAHAEVLTDETDGEADPDGPPTFPTDAARAEAALEAYRAVLEQYPSADAAPWARLGEAHSLSTLGRYEEARQAYQSAEQEGAAESAVVWRALEGRAFTFEAEQKWDEALEVYEELGAIAGQRFQPVANYHAARMYIAKGEPDRAKDTLRTVVDGLNEAANEENGQEFPFVLAQAQTRLHELDPSASPPPSPSASPFGDLGAGPGGNLTPEQMQELIRRFQEQQQQGGGAE